MTAPAALAGGEGDLLAATQDGQIHRSVDGGGTWSVRIGDRAAETRATAFVPGRASLLAAACTGYRRVMGPMAIRRATRRHTRRKGGLCVVLAVTGVLVLHHSGDAMAGMHHDGMGPTAIEMCIGAFTAIGATVAAVALSVLALGRWRISPLGPIANVELGRRPPPARARAGPPPLALLCVLRR